MWGQPPTAVLSSAARRLPLAAGQSSTNDQPQHTRFLPGDTFKLFMVAYLSFRFLCDFLKPYPRIFLGLGGIQWACVLVLLYYSRDIVRWLRPAPPRASAPA
jgi:hypothetical protein